MRGRLLCCRPTSWSIRLTPANAGTTIFEFLEGMGMKAHPRECGDDFLAVTCAGLGEGSPPRMRGRQAGLPFS